MFSLSTLVSALFFFGAPLARANGCDPVAFLSATLSGDPSLAAPPIAPWSFAKADLKLSPEQVLPAPFLAEIAKRKLGDVKVVLPAGPSHTLPYSVQVGTSHQDEIVRWQLQQDPQRRETLIVESVRLENPLAKSDPASLGLSQARKGLPFDVFRYAQNQLVKIARAGGYDRIQTMGQQNYSVLMLYMRIAGMSPATAESERIVDALNRSYEFARTQLPPELQVKSLQDFSAMIGDFFTPAPTYNAEHAWQQFQSQGTLPANFQAVKGQSGEVEALIEKGVSSSTVFLVNMADPQRPLLNWNKIARRIPLKLDVP